MTINRQLGVVALAFTTALACAPSPLVSSEDDRDTEKPDAGDVAADSGRAPSGSSDAGRRPDGGGTAGGGNRGDAGTGGGGGGGGFSGAYAILIDVPQVWTVSLLGTQPSLIRILVRADISGDVPTINVDGNLCEIDIQYEGNLTISVPDSAISAIPGIMGQATVAAAGGALDISSGPFLSLGGWETTTPTEALPTTLTDPRVTNPDGDANPGITLNLVAPGIVTGDIYIAIRAAIGFEASASNIERFEATSSSDVEVSILGATSGLVPSGLIQSVPGDAALKRFALVQVQDNSCAAILAAKATLFP